MYMDDIKQFAKHEKELKILKEAVGIYDENKGMKFSLEKCAMQKMGSRKREMTEGIEYQIKKKIKTLGEKETFEIPENIRSGHHQICREETRFKRVSKENEKTTRNKTILQKSHQKDKHLDCFPYNILGTIPCQCTQNWIYVL